MKVEYFIGIIIPKDYLIRIEKFQNKWIKQLGVEPHITLKAQGGLTSDERWIEKVRTVCKHFKPFQVSLGKPKYFGDNILYLSVKSNDLVNLHQEMLQKLAPPKHIITQYFEGDEYVPHLTLGTEYVSRDFTEGLSKVDLKEMEKLANEILVPFPNFEVNSIRIYKLNIEKNIYEKHLDISLSD
ncbi:2'-5' RNA ligase family protein [Exiguobacterium sp. AT1b]|uniref:2'-5' RNA ligase n=1 Tax=Exiguobacterium sp. (strain ATCC BAA-1283 / AT1b) TaxID=360911 RepID=C4L4K3_EXISA|nr:2'-5' RNA ligase family protein [Exiguobacterium sp. AT1b]ACQ71566.1 hypothetical protein EAT1b_2650 [Exiguobacterium sp. AT1b]